MYYCISDCDEYFLNNTTDILLEATIDVLDITGIGPVIAIRTCNANISGWTTIQRRIDDSVNFTRGWDEYEQGFGDKDGNYWMGLLDIHSLTKPGKRGRVYLESFDPLDELKVIYYDNFYIDDASSFYRLTFNYSSGNVEDSLAYHHGQVFSTMDRDNRGGVSNCAATYGAAWWYDHCHRSNLNGRYYNDGVCPFAYGITWEKFKGQEVSLKRVIMSIT